MNTSVKKVRVLTLVLAFAALVSASLAIAVPVSHAGGNSKLQGSGLRSASSLCPCNRGLLGGPESARAVEASSRSETQSQCPCNRDLLGGPRLAAPVARSSMPVGQSNGGFDWADAGVGAGAMLGILIFMAGLGNRVRTARRGRAAAGSA
jgi:hypothetical protein